MASIFRKLLCQNVDLNELYVSIVHEFNVKVFLGLPRGAEWPDLKKSKNPYAERWSQPTVKISAF